MPSTSFKSRHVRAPRRWATNNALASEPPRPSRDTAPLSWWPTNPGSTTTVNYQDLVTAMDIAVGTCSDNPANPNLKICFRDVGLTDAQGLSERPHQ